MSDSVSKVISGKKLEIKQLDPGDMLDLFEAIGPRPVGRAWMVYASAVCSVRTIDDVPVPFPTSVDAIKKLARDIGTEGMNEVLEMNNPTSDTTEAAADREATKN